MGENDKITDRINAILAYSELSANSFAKKIGVLQQTFINYLAGRQPSYETLNAIVTTFVEINPDWLLTGQGSMLRNLAGSYPATPTGTPANVVCDAPAPVPAPAAKAHHSPPATPIAPVCAACAAKAELISLLKEDKDRLLRIVENYSRTNNNPPSTPTHT